MKTQRSCPLTFHGGVKFLVLLVAVIGIQILGGGLARASAYTDAMARPAWFEGREPTSIPNPLGTGPSGWSPVPPDNSPEPAAPEVPAAPEAPEETTTVISGLTLSTTALLVDGTQLSNWYTCEGTDKKDLSIPLSWQWTTAQVANSALGSQDIPLEDIQSFAITMTDELGAGYWAVYNIGPKVMAIPQGVPKTEFWGGLYQARNDFASVGYTGPCPTDDLQHTYYITLSALSQQLSFPDPTVVTFQDVTAAIQNSVEMAANLQVTYTRGGPAAPGVSTFQLLSDDFAENDFIPRNFTCDGNNVSPQLNWRGAPDDTQSFALLVTDTKDGKSHWVLHVPALRNSLNRGIPYGFQPGGAELYQGQNDFGNLGYDGPCPPAFDGVHTYEFELLALDIALPTDNPLNDDAVRSAAEGHILDRAILTGRYEREEGGGTGTFKITSPDFVDGGMLPTESRSDFDTTTAAIECFEAPVDVDTFVPADPGLADCPDDNPDTDGDESVYQGDCKVTVGNVDVVYICPANKASCSTSQRIPELWVGGNLTNASPGQSPALEWTNIPPGTSSLVLLVTDDDLVAAGTTGMQNNLFARWVAYNLPATLSSLSANQGKVYFASSGYYQGFNDVWWRDTARTNANPYGDGFLDVREDIGYWGPCMEDHHISYTLVALNKLFQASDFSNVNIVTYEDLVNAMRGNILGTAGITGIVP
jgi:Raf kinase inhibitor-like YbhB/YbcL family protein